MNILEALKQSNKIKRKHWAQPYCFYYSESIIDLSYADLDADDWEPVLPEKKKVKKKLYHALYKISESYQLSYYLYENESEAIKNYGKGFVRLIIEHPIEIEVEEKLK